MIRRFFKDSAIYTVPAVFSKGIAFFLLPLYTRVASPAEYGALDLILAFGSIASLVVALEISQAVARFYTMEPNEVIKKNYASTALWFTIICYCSFLALSLFFSGFISSSILGIHYEDLFKIGVIYITLHGVFIFTQNQFKWQMESKRHSIASLLFSLSTAFFAVWFGYFLDRGIHGILWGMVLGSAISLIYSLINLRSTFMICFDINLLREMIFFSAPLVLSGISIFVTNYIDRIMINWLLGIDQVGVYGIAYRLASVAGFTIIGFRLALTPLIYRHIDDPETPENIKKIFQFFVIISTFLFSFLTLSSEFSISLLASPEYEGGAGVIVFLVPAIFLSSMYVFTPGIAISKRTTLIACISAGAALINIILNYILIRSLDIKGAALATFITYSLAFFVYASISQRYFYVPHSWFRIASFFLISFILVYAESYISPVGMSKFYIDFFIIGLITVLAFLFNLLTLNQIRGALISIGLLKASAPDDY